MIGFILIVTHPIFLFIYIVFIIKNSNISLEHLFNFVLVSIILCLHLLLINRSFDVSKLIINEFSHLSQFSITNTYSFSRIYINGDFSSLTFGDDILFTDLTCSKPITKYKNPVSFNFKSYLYGKHINISCQTSSYSIIGHNETFLDKIKNLRITLIKKFSNVPLITSLLLGYKDPNNSDLYGETGVSHLFVISGTHIAVIIMLINNISGYFGLSAKARRNLLTCTLLLYSFISGFNLPVIRVIFIYIMKLYYPKIDWYYISLGFLLFINPFYTYNYSFILSYLISYYILNFLNTNTGILNLLKTNFELFFLTLPFQLHFNCSFNLLSPLINIILIPMFTFIVIPFCVITLFFPLSFIININNILYRTITNCLSLVSHFQIYVGIHHIITIYIYYFGFFIFKYYKYQLIKYFLVLFIICIVYNQYMVEIIIPDAASNQFIIIKALNNNIIINPPDSNFNNELNKLLKYYQIYHIDYLVNINGDQLNSNLIADYFNIDQNNLKTINTSHLQIVPNISQNNCTFTITKDNNRITLSLVPTQETIYIQYNDQQYEISYSNNIYYNPNIDGLLEVIV